MVRLQFRRHFLLISREKKGLHFMRLLPSPQHLSLLKGYYKTAAKGENKISQMKIEQKEPDAKKLHTTLGVQVS